MNCSNRNKTKKKKVMWKERKNIKWKEQYFPGLVLNLQEKKSFFQSKKKEKNNKQICYLFG